MVSIKGPRSALTDFIDEHGIKINKLKNKPQEIKKEKTQTKRKIINKTHKKSKPFELASKDNHSKSLQNILIRKILQNVNFYKLEDKHLEMISSFLSTNRSNNTELFNIIINKYKEIITIYDCSMIKEEDYKIKNFKIKNLSLHQCGQLTNYKFTEIKKNMENLEILRITGAYLLTEISLPSKLKILDLSNCNRLTNSIIKELNRKYKTLEELKLSYCYKISHEVKLKTHIKRLFLEETRIHENFYNVQNLTALSLKNCVLIDSLCEKYANLEYLDLENITTIKNINVGNKLKHLNLQRCYNLVDWIKENKSKLTNLEYLNISYLEIKDMDFLVELKNLKEINLSWCDNVTDNLLIELIKNTNIEKISVFGCFNLTLESVKISYKFKDKVLVLGNHAETKFLIQNI